VPCPFQKSSSRNWVEPGAENTQAGLALAELLDGLHTIGRVPG
jgi:hypothetical protein